jgi:hypothetical protein
MWFPLSRDIWKQSRKAMQNVKLDVHAKLMKAYKEVPDWWFYILLAGSVFLSLLMSFVWKETVQLPWWGMLFAFGLAWLVTLPIGVIQATTNQVSPILLIFCFSSLPVRHSKLCFRCVGKFNVKFFLWTS